MPQVSRALPHSSKRFTKLKNSTPLRRHGRHEYQIARARQMGRLADAVPEGQSRHRHETALELARHGALVVLACLNEERGKEAETKLREALAATPEAGKVEFMKLDVGSLDSVHKFSAAFKNTHDRLDLLINNAGVAGGDYALSADGYELPTIWATSR